MPEGLGNHTHACSRGLEQASELLEGEAQVKAALARATAAAGDRASARQMLEELEVESGYLPPYEVAKAYLALGAINKAFDWLECALANRAHSMVLLRVDPQLAGGPARSSAIRGAGESGVSPARQGQRKCHPEHLSARGMTGSCRLAGLP